LNTKNTSPVYSRNSSQATCTPKKTWKCIAAKNEIYVEKAVAGPDLGEKKNC